MNFDACERHTTDHSFNIIHNEAAGKPLLKYVI